MDKKEKTNIIIIKVLKIIFFIQLFLIVVFSIRNSLIDLDDYCIDHGFHHHGVVTPDVSNDMNDEVMEDE